MVKIKILKEKDKIKELGDKICRLVDYYEHKKGRVWELAALADVLFAVCRILRSYDERIKKLEKHIELLNRFNNLNLEHHDINETGGVNKIKIILNDPRLRKKRGD